ncbi:hypothetical protein [Streptomyces boluensis]|uniref:Uncharacterized protein n=1 Tax=Streptomyces boluensis TaxID=1775135 RepID=A0A964XPE4_9ACTN|nr:hypothetical protein [Streptomyces boluensis]NBE55161.1 hypothetical protein [Streptomyces boluensis]
MDTSSATREARGALRYLAGIRNRRQGCAAHSTAHGEAHPEAHPDTRPEARPDLQVPLYPPDTRPAVLVRNTLVRLNAPRFAEARTANRWWLLALLALSAVQFSMTPQARPYAAWAAVALMTWLLARVYALGLTEKRQRRYEQRWLAARSTALRDTWFEVVGCTVQARPGTANDGRRAVSYVPARPADVRALLARQAEERAAGRSSRLTVEFTFPLPGSPYAALEVVDADLTDVDLVTTARGGGVRFPHAAYHPESPRSPRERHRPTRGTFWVLGVPVLALAAPGDESRAGAGRYDESVGG